MEKYKQALALYDRILAAQPNSYRAQQMSARCLMAMAERTTDRGQRGELARTAQRRFAAAARAAEADWSLYHAWATMLVLERNTMTAAADQRVAQLQQARKLFEKSVAMAGYSRDEAAARRGHAICLAYLADGNAEVVEKRKLCLVAIAEFESVNKLRPDDIDAYASGMWGLSLMNLARLDNDRLMARRAIERMQVSVRHDPVNATTLYNMACAYVMINDSPTALRYLRACLEHDPDHSFYRGALKDPDLRAVRDKAEFEALVREFQPPKP